jgi:hypothetical protein
MTFKEVRATIVQLCYTYGYNRQQERPLELHFTGMRPTLTDLLRRNEGTKTWKVFMHEQSVTQLFDSKDLIYLSPEAEEVLTDVAEDKTYVGMG